MIITCERISDAHAARIESLPRLARALEPRLVCVLFYLAGRAEDFRHDGTAAGADYAELLDEVFEGAIEAATEGRLV